MIMHVSDFLKSIPRASGLLIITNAGTTNTDLVFVRSSEKALPLVEMPSFDTVRSRFKYESGEVPAVNLLAKLKRQQTKLKRKGSHTPKKERNNHARSKIHRR